MNKRVLTNRIEQELFDYKDLVAERDRLRKLIKINHSDKVKLKEVERILDAIDTVYNFYDDETRRFIQLRYWSALKPDFLAVSSKLHIGRATAFRWRDNVVEDIAKILGWSLNT